MSKPLFFTGRKEIARSHVRIRLLQHPRRPTRFHAEELNLSSYDLPNDAQVVIEAYNNVYFERFSLGRLEVLETTPRELQIPPGDRPLFRLKVVKRDQQGDLLLAALDELRPVLPEEEGGAASLLPLVPKTREEMGQLAWRVHFVAGSEPEPELWVNVDMSGLFGKIQQRDPFVSALLMPEVLRQVIWRFAGPGENWAEDGTAGRWLQLAACLGAEPFDDWDEDDDEGQQLQKREEWVNDVIAAFAFKHRLLDEYIHLTAEIDDDQD